MSPDVARSVLPIPDSPPAPSRSQGRNRLALRRRQQGGEGRAEVTVPMVFSADETTDVGSDTASPVSDDYRSASSIFTGKVSWVQLDIDEAAEDLDHLISPEEPRVAMARQ